MVGEREAIARGNFFHFVSDIGVLCKDRRFERRVLCGVKDLVFAVVGDVDFAAGEFRRKDDDKSGEHS